MHEGLSRKEVKRLSINIVSKIERNPKLTTRAAARKFREVFLVLISRAFLGMGVPGDVAVDPATVKADN
jgi:hypothetical protein